MYHFDISKAAGSTELHSIVRLTAQQIEKDTYLRIGDWIRNLSTPDLATLVMMESLMVDHPSDPFASTISTLAFLLAQAEGTDVTKEHASILIGSLITLIEAESLARKGFVEIDYDRITLDPSSIHDKIIRLSDKYIEYLADKAERRDQTDDRTPPT